MLVFDNRSPQDDLEVGDILRRGADLCLLCTDTDNEEEPYFLLNLRTLNVEECYVEKEFISYQRYAGTDLVSIVIDDD